jgi:hypothetical protein
MPKKPAVSSSSGRETVDLKVADEIAKKEGDEYWLSYGHELELEKEVAEVGVEKIDSGEVPIPDDLAQKMGIKKVVGPDTPIHKAIPEFEIRGKVLTDDQLTAGKKQPPSKSIRWLVEWFIYELLKAHVVFEWIKGKFKRV